MEQDNVYFEFIDITSRTYNNTSNLNISIKNVDVQTSINSEKINTRSSDHSMIKTVIRK